MNEKTFFGFKTGPKGLFNVANLFTVLRIPLGICGIVLYEGGNEAVGILVLVVAALTDLADGQVARRSGCASQFGAILDPTVDKTGMVIMGLWSLTQVGDAWPYVLAILLMEFVLAAQTLYALKKGVQIMTDMKGKWAISWRALAVLMFIVASNGSGDGHQAAHRIGLLAFVFGIIMGAQALWIYRTQLRQATA